jgi:hypothetical protein
MENTNTRRENTP